MYTRVMRPLTLVLTVPVVVLLAQPLWAPQWGAGILGELAVLGAIGSAIAVAVFFGLVALYCRSLQRMLQAIAPPDRARSPRSVWLMFAIPFNFVEDFFIVADLASSLRRDGRTAPGAARLWLILGETWCVLQIASLLPREAGVVSGALALLAWTLHWVHTGVLHRRILSVPARVG